MDFEKRLTKLEETVGQQQEPQLTFVLQSVKRDKDGRLVATGESRIVTGGSGFSDFEEYPEPRPIDKTP